MSALRIMNRRQETLTLRDGRTLGFAFYGDPTGRPVLFIPGYGFSRLTRHPDDGVTARAGARVLVIDMPGFGLSDPYPGYQIGGWTDDIAELLVCLGIDRFSVMGWSWGTPYALACAARLPGQVIDVTLVSGLLGWLAGRGSVKEVRPEFRTFALWCRHAKPLARWFLRHQAKAFVKDPAKALDGDARSAPPADRQLMAEPAMRAMLMESQLETWRRGAEGMYEHSLAVTQPWDFAVADVKAHARVWQGTMDPEILPGMADHAAALPSAEVHRVPGAGHLLIFTHWSEILTSIGSSS